MGRLTCALPCSSVCSARQNKTDLFPRSPLICAVSYVSSYFHCIFSTKDRRPLLTPQLRDRLWPFLGGIARQNDLKALEIGGVEDHVHILLSLPAAVPVSKAMQLIKGGSSKWVHETFPEQSLFSWQEKYGAFSVSVSQLEHVRKYIQEQAAHHRKLSFQEEFIAFLNRHRINYDPKYLWERFSRPFRTAAPSCNAQVSRPIRD